MDATQAKFELREARPGWAVLTCHGGLSEQEREHLAVTLEQYLVGRDPVRGLVLDLTGVRFVDSAGLGALFQLVQRVRGRGAEVAFAGPAPAIRRLLLTVGLGRLAHFTDDVDAALHRPSPDAGLISPQD